MKNNMEQKGGSSMQGNPTSDRTFHQLKDEKKKHGISNGGGQRSDQTSNKDNQRKRGEI